MKKVANIRAADDASHYTLMRARDSSGEPLLGFWSGGEPVPEIGDRVKVNFNSLGEGIVQGYFIESGFLGLSLKPVKRPQWHIDQHGPDWAGHYHVFGAEITPLKG